MSRRRRYGKPLFSFWFIDVASALCADSFEPQARRYSFRGGVGAGVLSGRSGVSAERRHLDFGQWRSADAPLRSKKFSARGDSRPAKNSRQFAKFAD
jgi:hypothetical protein